MRTRRLKPKMVVSLYAELGEVLDAIRGAGALVAAHREETDDTALGPAEAVLSLVGARLALLRESIGGRLDAAHLLAPHNAVPSDASKEGDLALTPKATPK